MQRNPLVLFDIDGTLLRTAGAGREALDEAFAAVCGWPDATAGVHIAGSTDERILRDVALRFAAPWEQVDAAAIRAAYLASLARRVAEPGRASLCPGVRELLAALAARPDVAVALLTGNWEAGAKIKLGAVGLAFDWGVYADDAVERDDLVPVARARAEARGLAVGEVIVVGDTVADVRCARAGGARVVSVETGFSPPEAIAAERPDLQLPDLARGSAWFFALL